MKPGRLFGAPDPTAAEPKRLLKHLVTSFLVPPGPFVVLPLFLGVLFLRRRRAGAGIAMVLLGVSLWTVSTASFSDRLIGRLEGENPLPEDPRGDVVVLLGGGVNDRSPDLTGTGFPSDAMLGRIVTAARLQRRLGVPVIVSGGKVFEDRGAEAPVVGRILADLGVPGDRIVLEDRSRDTRENAEYTGAVIARAGFRRPLLVTSAYHMPRARFLFERAGVAVVPVPASFRAWPPRAHGWDDYLPSAEGLRNVSAAAKEWLGIAWYRLVLRGAPSPSAPAVGGAAR